MKLVWKDCISSRQLDLVGVISIIVVAGVLFRLLMFLIIDHQFMGGDSSYYLKVAQNIEEYGVHIHSSGDKPEFYRVPLYPAFLAAISSISKYFGLSDSYFYVVVFVQSVLGIVLGLSIAWLIPNKKIAVLAGLITVTIPGVIVYEHRILSESLAVFCVVLGLLLWSRSRDIRFAAVAAGVLIGLGILTNQIFLMLPIGLVLFSLMFQRALVGKSVIVSLVCVAVLAPWLIRNASLENGGWFLSQGTFGFNLWVGTWERNGDWVEEGFPDEAFRTAEERELLTGAMETGNRSVFKEVAFNRIAENPIAVAGVWLKRLPFLWIGTRTELVNLKLERGTPLWTLAKVAFWGYNSAFLLLGVLGGVVLAIKRDKHSLLLILVLYITSIYVPFHNQETRYTTAGLPILSIFVAYALCQLRWLYLAGIRGRNSFMNGRE